MSDKDNKEQKKSVDTQSNKGFVGKVVTSVFRPFIYATSGYKSGLKSVKNQVSNTKDRVVKSKEIMNANINDPDIELMQKNFQALMMKWGIEDEEQLDNAKKYFKMHAIGGLLGVLLLVVYLVLHLIYNDSYYAIIAIVLFSFASSLVALSSFWRFKVLDEKRFIPFFKWLVGKEK